MWDRRSILGVAGATMVAAPNCLAETREADVRIARIERNLLPFVKVRGRPDPPPTTILDELAALKAPSLSIAVIEGGRLAWARAYGVVANGSGTPATTKTIYQAASISKPLSASAALRLVEQGKLSLDAPINSQLHSWQLPENEMTRRSPVTLRRLLSHTAGTTVSGFGVTYPHGERLPTTVDILAGRPPAKSAPVVVDVLPGSTWRYSGGGTMLEQLAMEDAAGTDFATLMQSLVLGPLQMNSSTFAQPLPPALARQAAPSHLANGDPLPGGYDLRPELAAASLTATPSDIALWIMELQKACRDLPNRLLKPASARAMVTPGLGSWGLGVKIDGEGPSLRFGHTGENRGAQSEMLGYLNRGSGLVVMVNGDNAYPIISRVIHAVAEEYGWPGLGRKVVDPAPLDPKVRAAITGGYANKGAIAVFSEGDTLILKAPRERYELIPTADGRFVMTNDIGSPVNFPRDANGKVAALEITGTASTDRFPRFDPP